MASMRIEQHGEDVLIWIKAVPGASRNAIAGTVGERLKVRVGAPPEGGRANQAIGAVLAQALNLKPRDISIESGTTSREKIVRISGVSIEHVRTALGLHNQ